MQTPAIVPLILPVHILAGALALMLGYVALYAAKGATLHRRSGILYVVAMLTLLAAGVGDRRVRRAGGVGGAPRLKRHLWRMCFALFIASIAFYGDQGRVPEAIRIPALLTAAVLLPLMATSYWFWRLRGRHGARESRVCLLRTVGSE